MSWHRRVLAGLAVSLAALEPAAAQWPTGRTGPSVPAVGVATPGSPEHMRRWYQTTTDDSVRRFRALLVTVMTPEQRRREARIRYETVLSDDPTLVEADEVDGTRVIRISVGFARLLEALVEAQAVASTTPSDSQLAKRYIQYVADTVTGNAVRVRNRQMPLEVAVFPRWMGWAETERLRQWSSTPAGTLRSVSLFTAFGFVVAHETAHHVYGHKRYGEKTLAQARADELEADRFALDSLRRLELQPNAAAPLIAFWGLLGSNPVERETSSTHPASERRILELNDYAFASVADDPEFLEYLRKNGLVERWAQLRSQSQTLAKELAAMTASASEAGGLPWGSIRLSPP